MTSIDWVLMIRACKTRRQIAAVYLAAMRSVEAVDWGSLNRAILARYAPSGLDYIKKLAWQELEK